MENDEFIHGNFIERERRYSKLFRLLDQYSDGNIFVENYSKKNNSVSDDRTIWILWLQGMDTAPVIVQKCYASILQYKPEDFNIVLLARNNLFEYISLPDYIVQKYDEGKISATHFSDIIRVELLYMYGGLWIDATVFCMDTIPAFMYTGQMFAFKIPGTDTEPVTKISNWWIYSQKRNRIICALRNMLHSYWKKEDDIVDYYLFHIIFSKLVETDLECNFIYRRIPYYNSGNAHVLFGKLDHEYSNEDWEIIKFTSPIQKLSYKKRFLQGDIYSNYVRIISQ